MAGPGVPPQASQTPLVDLSDGELVMLALSLLVSDLSARTAKASPAVGQRIAAVAVECRKRAGIVRKA